MRKMMILAALAVLAASPSAWARTGSLACGMMVSEFAADAADSRNRLSANQMAAVRQLVDIGRGQCRSSPDIVEGNVTAMRQALAIGSGPQAAGRFDDFWPADREELSELTK